jgi:hypothetical protein
MATYDPNKTYTWGPDVKFVLSGQDFSLMLHAMRGILSTKEASNVILAYELNKKIEAMLGDAVAEGKVVEAAPQGEDFPVAQYEEVMAQPAQAKKAKLVKK